MEGLALVPDTKLYLAPFIRKFETRKYVGQNMINAITTSLKAMLSHKTLMKIKESLSSLTTGRAGGLMIETVVAVSLMTVVGTAVLSGLSTTHISGAKTEQQSIAENIARNQMASIFAASYKTNGQDYPAVALPASQATYSVTAGSDEVATTTNACIQKIMVNVRFEGRRVMDLESIKSDPSC